MKQTLKYKGEITLFVLNFHSIYNVPPNYQFARLTPQIERIVSMCHLLSLNEMEIKCNYEITLMGCNEKQNIWTY